MTEKEYQELLNRGREIFRVVGGSINVIGNEHIWSRTREYRRKSDFDEMCIALAVFEKTMLKESAT